MLYGIYRAVVIANRHPAKDGWVYLRLVNQELINKRFWAAPAFPNGQFFMPCVGDMVFVMFEEGYMNSPLYMFQAYLPSKTPSEVKDTYPSRRILKTRKGHKIEFEETNQKEMLSITSAPKSGKSHNITLDVEKDEIRITHSSGKSSIVMGQDGIVKLITGVLTVETKDVNWQSEKVSWKAGDILEFTDKNGNKMTKDKNGIILKDKSGNRILMDSKGFKIVDKFGGFIEMKSGKITITSKGTVVLSNGTKGVVRAGDSARPHSHKFVLSSPTGPVSGQILPSTVKFDVASQRVKAG